MEIETKFLITITCLNALPIAGVIGMYLLVREERTFFKAARLIRGKVDFVSSRAAGSRYITFYASGYTEENTPFEVQVPPFCYKAGKTINLAIRETKIPYKNFAISLPEVRLYSSIKERAFYVISFVCILVSLGFLYIALLTL